MLHVSDNPDKSLDVKEEILRNCKRSFEAENDTRSQIESLAKRGKNTPFSTTACHSSKREETSVSSRTFVPSSSSIDDLRSKDLNNSSIDNVDLHSSLPIVECLKIQKSQLIERIRQKEETLRKLKLVKMYRSKNDVKELEELSVKWRQVSQTALQDLFLLIPEPRPSMLQLIQNLQLDVEKLGYNDDDDSFS